jgi:hypothetical protein
MLFESEIQDLQPGLIFQDVTALVPEDTVVMAVNHTENERRKLKDDEKERWATVTSRPSR